MHLNAVKYVNSFGDELDIILYERGNDTNLCANILIHN
jgi:hypothetical protein